MIIKQNLCIERQQLRLLIKLQINFNKFQNHPKRMQKQITISEIKAVYSKDFETFGKMDPFLVFSIGKSEGKTQTANNAGKQPSWKATVLLNYFDQQSIVVKSYQEDLSTNQYMGEGKIDVKTLKASGTLQFKMFQQNKNAIGTVTCKYSLKTLPPTPILLIKNIKCQFYKETKFLLKTKPYFTISCNGKNIVSQVKQQGNAKSLTWDQTLRVKVKQGQKITFSVEDKNDQNKKIFGYDTFVKEFRTLSGSKSYNVVDKNYQPLGVIQFDYETLNLVNKEQSVKNEEGNKKQSNQMFSITIQKIKGNLSKAGKDLYFKINVGPTLFKSTVVKSAKKDFVQQLQQLLYCDKKQNKIIFAAYNKGLAFDDLLGVGEIQVQGLTTGQKTISLKNQQQSFGQITLILNVKKVVCKSITLSDIKLKLATSSDMIGKGEPFINAKIGGWSGRTQTGEQQTVTFTKSINLKFSDEKQMTIQIFDQDIDRSELVHRQKINIENYKESGETIFEFLHAEQKDPKKKSQLSFKYVTKNVYKPPKKQQSPKKQQIPRKSSQFVPYQQPKKDGEPAGPIQQRRVRPQPPVILEQPPKQSPPKQQKLKQQKKNQKTINNSSLDNSTINKSRDAVKLPIIQDARNYGDKIFDKQSSATLQKSIHVFSVPKADRFSSGPKYSGEPSYYIDSCFKPNSGKGVGFGFGNKKQFPDWMQRNMKQNPAPGAYIPLNDRKDQFRPRGPTFGISHKYYQKVTIPKQKNYKSSQRLNPITQNRTSH